MWTACAKQQKVEVLSRRWKKRVSSMWNNALSRITNRTWMAFVKQEYPQDVNNVIYAKQEMIRKRVSRRWMAYAKQEVEEKSTGCGWRVLSRGVSRRWRSSQVAE